MCEQKREADVVHRWPGSVDQQSEDSSPQRYTVRKTCLQEVRGILAWDIDIKRARESSLRHRA